MDYNMKTLTNEELQKLFSIEEDHFNDFKSKSTSGKGFSKIISAFGNASGGDVYVGIREESGTKIKHWEGFLNIEECNAFLQIMDTVPSVLGYYDVEFLRHPVLNTYVLRITVFKTQSIVYTTDGKIYLRKGAQSLPVDTREKQRRLELDKGVFSYEDEPVSNSAIEDVIESEIFDEFSNCIIPEAVPEEWLKK